MFAKLVALKNNKKRGFTLIELIVVIAIIGILIAILVPTVMGFINDARDSQLAANAKTVFVASQAYLTKLSTTGGTAASLDISGTTALTDAHALFPYLGAFNPDGATYTVSVSGYAVTSVVASQNGRSVTVDSSGMTATGAGTTAAGG